MKTIINVKTGKLSDGSEVAYVTIKQDQETIRLSAVTVHAAGMLARELKAIFDQFTNETTQLN